MSVLLVQISIPTDDGLPENGIVNTFHFETDNAPTSTDLDTIRDDLEDFYEGAHAGAGSGLTTNFSDELDTANARIRIYDLADATPRVPLRNELLGLPAAGSAGLPAEVALCMSFHGAQVSGEPQARKRNRIYFGPIAASSVGYLNGHAIPDSSLVAKLADAGAELQARSDARAGTLTWVTFSPTQAAATTLGGGTFPVVNGWVDNAFDTQRRRGMKATTRNTFS